ncbi:MAG: DNA methyltransferase [Pseudomonadota bacterium]
MNQKYEKLKVLLKELFQLDQPDLDFGIYRIMHAKSAEVTQFLDKDLLPQVQAAFDKYAVDDKAEIEKELAKATKWAQELGADPETMPKVQGLRARLKHDGVDIFALESEVYDHLFSFFRRYYSEGDFLAKRVYKPGIYAIPYEGEEVTLHWANKDQFYIKSSEYLRDYAFRLQPHDDKVPMRVHFRLADATEGEHGNVKAAEGKDRVFILAALWETGRDFIAEENGEQGMELVIRFEYRPATLIDWPEDDRAGKSKPPAQKDMLALAVRRVLAVTDTSLAPWIAELGNPHITASGEMADYTRLEAHLRRYTARNTFDYFIHKDLGGFLRRELDFYIKNEVMHLDDVENETALRVEQYLSKIKVIRKIAGKIIDFLAQIEDFQKKLWLKKKLVVETQYCITLGCIPEEFYTEIAANDAQHEEWVKLYAIDEIKGDLITPGYSKKLEPEFMKANPTLVVDTRHFDANFTARLLEAVGDVGAQTDGVLFHSENFQALSLMQQRYQEQVDCIYIDPPYNTDASAIDYKNGYKASSWMSLLNDRLLLSKSLLVADGVLIAAIDDEQQRELSFLLSGNFDGQLLGTVCVRANPSGRPTQAGYSVSHEYLLFAGRGPQSVIGRMPPTEAQISRFSQIDEDGLFEWRNLRREGSDSDRTARPAMYYPIYIQGTNLRVPMMDWDEQLREWRVLEDPAANEIVVWPKNEAGTEKRWRWEWQTVMLNLNSLAVRLDRSGCDYVYVKRRPHEEGVVSVSSWFDAKYSATEHGTALLKALFGKSPFSYPKSIHAVVDSIYIGGAQQPNGLVLDYFAGSGTTGHAVINLNRCKGGRRRFVLIEQGDYFDTVLLPRIKKVTFTPEWKDGKPKRLASPEEAERSPRIVKVVRLESYEDTLNNLETRLSVKQQALLFAPEAQGADGLKEQYLLRYMLEVETRGSQSLLNVQAFTDSTAYRLKVKRPGSDESREVNVDLLETFNWLIGLTIRKIAAPRRFSAAFERDVEKRLRLKNSLKQVDPPPDPLPKEEGEITWWFRTVTGALPDGRKTLVIWRKLTGDPEQDNLVLDAWFSMQGYLAGDSEIDLIYVNGGNNLENLKAPGDTWTVRLIEADFQRLMFEMEST